MHVDAAATAALARIDPEAYARTRNHLEGAVTGLSPFLTHGVLGMRELLAHLQREHRLSTTHKLVLELGWREFFRHCWHHDGEGIFSSRHAGPLPDTAYARELPPDIREGRTGFAVVDRAVRTLYETGYLHNHARLWLASFMIHLRKIQWRAGADWMYAHLLDGDLASNHLSWQWVAGTGSAKPYLFNAENVRRHAPSDWHVDRSALDTDYDGLDRMARDARFVMAPSLPAQEAIAAPPLASAPPAAAAFTPPDAQQVRGKHVWLVHAWCLRAPPPGKLAVAVLDAQFHRRWPWNPRRWRWVIERMNALADIRWMADGPALLQALAGAASTSGLHDPHLGALGQQLLLEPVATIWPEIDQRQPSFSAWWARVQPLTPDLAPMVRGST